MLQNLHIKRLLQLDFTCLAGLGLAWATMAEAFGKVFAAGYLINLVQLNLLYFGYYVLFFGNRKNAVWWLGGKLVLLVISLYFCIVTLTLDPLAFVIGMGVSLMVFCGGLIAQARPAKGDAKLDRVKRHFQGWKNQLKHLSHS